ncbi:zinc finger protein 62 homolog [Nylanderia fulva]|uniref:zinc finger protein 62 homolog n=1 Tax=Nylanderia fulva TaxID=613905 RepID=UPI0010FB5ECF|nr:zinc finger protein 62 homolog [Nylanderia fulva]XP_029167661.1 zinc finger protein 62 homolog [Nylanderia fulva]XP_029167662.1 zinc finger protein 62 homolog [Nylanderia fulva]XP_029167663.1 zinc finger protein 62 homolog [Nylanderia fulva]XP_029167664.1 zinc finger protein 62 homolog [Nylanderia fulva]XP_029167665.1 zinc finger protein 62 homolog [Nylanderia fulva]XP_029167666.1 zinc finger protein 62 homolog [Nylanderia fulva]XP_029167667.1 zinc finger protein 62 homolog [Nylanderia fu
MRVVTKMFYRFAGKITTDESSGKQKNKNRKNKNCITIRKMPATSCKKKTLNIPKRCTTKVNESNACLEENVKQSKAKRVAPINDINRICKLCNKTFSLQQSYHAHMRQHADKTQYKCHSCSKKFRTFHNLIRHRKNIHYDLKDYFCDICDKKFVDKTAMKNHRRIHTGERPYICNICNRSFRFRQNLKLHVKTHTNDPSRECVNRRKGAFHIKRALIRWHENQAEYNCHLCLKDFGTLSSLIRHRKNIHYDLKDYFCDICHKSFAGKTAMEDHRRIHIGERPYLCDMCGKLFRCKTNLRIHIQIHIGDLPYRCVFCDKGFISKRDVLLHSTKHTRERNQMCDVCGARFAREDVLKQHKKIVHSEERPYICKYGKSYKRKCDLKNHKCSNLGIRKSREIPVGPNSNLIPQNLNKNRNNKDYIPTKQTRASSCMKKTNDIATKCQGAKVNESNACFEENVKQSKDKRLPINTDRICKPCNKTFSSQQSYRAHIRQHKDKTQYKCRPSSKEFNTLDSLIHHQKNIHYAKKDHSCDICDKKFRDKFAMEDHRRIHTGEWLYVCDICNRAHISKHDLYRHVKRHTDDLRHKRVYNGKKCLNKSRMVEHLSVHKSAKNHICDQCDKHFIRKNTLIRHQKTVHSEVKPYKCQCGKSYKREYDLKLHKRIGACTGPALKMWRPWIDEEMET